VLSTDETFFDSQTEYLQRYEWEDIVHAMIAWVNVIVSAEWDGLAPGALLQEIQVICLWHGDSDTHGYTSLICFCM